MANLFPGARTTAAVDLPRVSYYVIEMHREASEYTLLAGSNAQPEVFAASYDHSALPELVRDILFIRGRRPVFLRLGTEHFKLPITDDVAMGNHLITLTACYNEVANARKAWDKAHVTELNC